MNSYTAGQKILVQLTVQHVEEQLVDGHPTGTQVAILDQHWRIETERLADLQAAGSDHALALLLDCCPELREQPHRIKLLLQDLGNGASGESNDPTN